MTELKPCPFCGSDKVKKCPCTAQYCDDEMIYCISCGASMNKNSMREAIEAWNRRAEK